MIGIRRLRSGDALDPARIARNVFDHTLKPDCLEAFLADPGHALLIAEVEGEVIGQLRALRVRHPDKAPEMMIENLGVTPAWHRRRVATDLVTAARAVAEGWGAVGVFVLTETGNGAARAFYRSLGWPESAVRLFDAS
ncbi:MAG: GNAT family N-acetyltransferase [Pseudomonadota bacterium]